MSTTDDEKEALAKKLAARITDPVRRRHEQFERMWDDLGISQPSIVAVQTDQRTWVMTPIVRGHATLSGKVVSTLPAHVRDRLTAMEQHQARTERMTKEIEYSIRGRL